MFVPLILFLSMFIHTLADYTLLEYAQSPTYQWNGVAIAKKANRFFAAFPRSYTNDTISVGEILSNGTIIPIPGGVWNTFNPVNSTDNPGTRFVSIHAVKMDSYENLWVVDDGNVFGQPYQDAPKLVQINITTNSVVRIYSMSSLNLTSAFVLNDVRFGTQYAYLTEFGTGGIIVCNLDTGALRRVLYNSSSTKFAYPTVVRLEGRVVEGPGGIPKQPNNDQLELSVDEQTLYYKPAFSYYWYSIPTAALINQSLTETELDALVQTAFNAMPSAGCTRDDQGFIYISDNERQAIWKIDTSDGSWELIVQDDRIIWGDASDIDANGYLYMPMSQVNRLASSNNGTNYVQLPFQMYRIKLSVATSIYNQYTFIFSLFFAFFMQCFSA